MRILVVGAGAVGGYFGGRLLQAGRDVTFLVRPRRAAQLAEAGLVIHSPIRDLHIAAPPTMLAQQIAAPFEVVLLACKAYDLDDAIESFAPAVGPQTMILPVMNGMQHLDRLDARFGSERVLGGQCVIATTLESDGSIRQLNAMHSLSFGERGGGLSRRVRTLAAVMSGVVFDTRASETILQEMWEKWVLLSTLAGSSCLMRAATGDIVAAPGGTDFIVALLDECASVATGAGHRPDGAFLERTRASFLARDALLTASLLRDIERGAPIEADHIIGDLIERGSPAGLPILRLAYCHLKAYEVRRARSSVS